MDLGGAGRADGEIRQVAIYNSMQSCSPARGEAMYIPLEIEQIQSRWQDQGQQIATSRPDKRHDIGEVGDSHCDERGDAYKAKPQHVLSVRPRGCICVRTGSKPNA